jgi:hypothetical protein
MERTGLLLLLLLIGGCVTTPVNRLGSAGNPDEASIAASPAAPTNPERKPPVAFEPSGAPVAVVLHDSGFRQLETLQVFSARLGRPYQIFNLAHRDPDAVVRSLESVAPIKVIALGPAAYDLTRTVPGLDVFYAGVLNPGRTTQGVDALPPFAVQLDYWQARTSGLDRLGVIGGSGMTRRMQALAGAAAEREIQLERRTVSSDTEMLLAFRSMVPHIDGFVLLPDETILSPRVIRQVLSHGRRNGVQILVYSPVMFNLGASLFLQPDPVRVADALVTLVNNPDTRPQVTAMRSRSRLAGQLELSAADVTVHKSSD